VGDRLDGYDRGGRLSEFGGEEGSTGMRKKEEGDAGREERTGQSMRVSKVGCEGRRDRGGAHLAREAPLSSLPSAKGKHRRQTRRRRQLVKPHSPQLQSTKIASQLDHSPSPRRDLGAREARQARVEEGSSPPGCTVIGPELPVLRI
jgi:hypothetical protein